MLEHGFLYQWLSTENRLRSQRNPTSYKIKVNKCKLIDLITRINSNNFSATILKFSEKFDPPFSHVFIFGNVFPESHGFAAMPVTSCIKDTCSNLLIQIVRHCDRHSNETVIHRKHVNLRTVALKFLELTRFLSLYKSINLQLFTSIFYGVGGPL